MVILFLSLSLPLATCRMQPSHTHSTVFSTMFMSIQPPAALPTCPLMSRNWHIARSPRHEHRPPKCTQPNGTGGGASRSTRRGAPWASRPPTACTTV